MAPSSLYEKKLAAEGHNVIGVDEVGCGCLAGPVIAAAVHLPFSVGISDINDSKLLSPIRRIAVLERFIHKGICWTIGMATVEEIDKFNIRNASLLAMQRAASAFKGATFALSDAWKIPNLSIAQRNIVHGDRLVRCIAAASIVAKVVRDRLMEEFDREFPQYAFKKHKGYGTLLHCQLLKKYGPCRLHRKSFI